MTVQRAFRRARRARCVDHHGRVVGRCLRGSGPVADGGEFAFEIENVAIPTVGADGEVQRRRDFTDAFQLRHAVRIGDEHLDAGVLQAIGDGVDAEQDGEWHSNGGTFVDAHMSCGDVAALRQHDADAVAARHAAREQHVGEAVGARLQGREGHRSDVIAVHVDDGCRVRLGGGPAVAADIGNIEAIRNEPLEGLVEALIITDFWQHWRVRSFGTDPCEGEGS